MAFLLTHKNISSTFHKVLGALGQADSQSHSLCYGHGDVINTLFMETNTSDLMKNGLVATQVTWELFKRHMQWDNDTPKHILTHQISKVHQEKCVQMLQIQNAKSYSDLEILGNTGSAAAPLSLARASDCFKAGEHIAMLGIGSGINTFMLGILW